MAQVRHPLQRSELLQQTNNVVISNRKSCCARQWVLCVGCPGSIETVWSIHPCIDQEEALLAKVYPWRQHHPGLHGQGGGIFQCKEGCVEWGSLSSLCNEGTRLHNVDNVYLWDKCNSWRREEKTLQQGWPEEGNNICVSRGGT